MQSDEIHMWPAYPTETGRKRFHPREYLKPGSEHDEDPDTVLRNVILVEAPLAWLRRGGEI